MLLTVVAVEPAMESRSAVSISKSSEELESLGERGRVLTLSIAARSIPEVRSDRAEDAIRCAEEATGAAVNVPKEDDLSLPTNEFMLDSDEN